MRMIMRMVVIRRVIIFYGSTVSPKLTPPVKLSCFFVIGIQI